MRRNNSQILGQPHYTPSATTMRLIKSQIEKKDGSGFATLLPEEPEDMVDHFANPNISTILTRRSGTPTTSSAPPTSSAPRPSAA